MYDLANISKIFKGGNSLTPKYMDNKYTDVVRIICPGLIDTKDHFHRKETVLLCASLLICQDVSGPGHARHAHH